MNIEKNMEAIFLAGAALILASSLASAAVRPVAAPVAVASEAHVIAIEGGPVQRIVITAKRLSAAEKAE